MELVRAILYVDRLYIDGLQTCRRSTRFIDHYHKLMLYRLYCVVNDQVHEGMLLMYLSEYV